jgi:hypothetical protein
MRRHVLHQVVSVAPVVLVLFAVITECRAQYRPDLFFREDFAETPAETPITQRHLSNDALELALYGPGADLIKKSNHDQPVDDPFYVWSGQAEGNWAVTLRNPDSYVDLSEYAKVVWRSKQSGLRCLRLIVKTAGEDWLVSGTCDGPSRDWRVHQFNITDVEWYELDIEEVVEGRSVTQPDLSRVTEVGFTDLMRGGGTPASSRLDWIEVYGRKVAR